MKKHVAVIGAGLSGIAAIKQLTDEGHKVICFERLDNLGGVFSRNEIYDDLHLTISNYFMAYSDDVPSNERLKFWSKAEYRKYLMSYVEKFNLEEKIKYSTEVVSVNKSPDANSWEVEVSCGGDMERLKFDAVVVCSGHFQSPKIPEIEGLDDFKGTVVHSKYYRDKNLYEGKRVLCVGMGESSADITSEISSVAKKCILSLRRYHAVAPRYMAFQEDTYFTIDTSWLTSRIVNRLPHRFHAGITKGIFKRYVNSRNPDLRIRGQWLMKSGPSFHQAVTKNERLFKPIADGKVIPNIGGIKRFDEGGVIFKDGTREEIDAVVFCSGYKLEFPFLNKQISDMRDLFKQMFIPEIGESLAFIGFVRPQQGGIPAIAEMQSRYLAQLYSNRTNLPSLQEQRQVIRQDAEHWRSEYSITPKVASLVNYCHYMDSIAELVGCMPEIPSLMEDPKLRIKLLHGPQFAAQYRLTGAHSMPEKAREFLLDFPNISSWRRIAYLETSALLCRILPRIPSFKVRVMSSSSVEPAI
ncbi:NAD(P)-binding domain-containing protein [Microbulbifer rhizosphaerae]|uniref:4-hydroxybenzoate brominase (decarboxylating) n=1 Tax=Microbulbifer rhizosphaerae TaxID=1562603 RepID=A0A7W4W9V8_9GAMM|nr:NAD(P)-binding domain-containing protein [Microbulbifer rhizosphaerae]MBB3060289.1 dimethylaniline monooxygenase (N-oxide forming) [Microbulbifer rhizosphaerae]